MTTAQLEQAILEAVQDIYQKKYIGKLKVEKTRKGYILKMWFNQSFEHMLLACEGNETKFLDFVKSELLNKHLERTEYFTKFKYDKYCND